MKQKNERPVILVVDTDEGYVNALEIKIIQKYIDKADIEFITDRNYLEEYLKTDHFVTVLVASEVIYTEKLQQLMPVFTFVLMDEIGNEKLGEFVYCIYRYSSSENILDIIATKVPESFFENEEEICEDTLEENAVSDFEFDAKLILVTAASGGVGKTTVAMGLLSIAEVDMEKVIYVNLDYFSNFDRLLKTEKKEFKNKILEVNQTFADEMSEEEKINVLCNIIKAERYDLVIVDTGMRNMKSQMKLYEMANIVLQITNNSNASIYAANKLYRELDQRWLSKNIYVCGDDRRISCEELPIFTIQNHISHIDDYEEQTMEDIRKNRDFLELYEYVKEKIEQY